MGDLLEKLRLSGSVDNLPLNASGHHAVGDLQFVGVGIIEAQFGLEPIGEKLSYNFV